MKKLNLHHAHTPDDLAEINSQLESVLKADSLDDEKLKQLITQRDTFILEHLTTLQDDAKKQFAELELKSNKKLSSLIEHQLSASLKQLSGLLKGQKAVNKYK
ncbi:hypothetical protein [Aliiglaciecola litoralis]|uniref:Uncharacterized protein n=1 Tax=Aliiglaciecola litoralis TaxID=582857 RepID=A0ABN1LLA8_9ALTE